MRTKIFCLYKKCWSPFSVTWSPQAVDDIFWQNAVGLFSTPCLLKFGFYGTVHYCIWIYSVESRFTKTVQIPLINRHNRLKNFTTNNNHVYERRLWWHGLNSSNNNCRHVTYLLTRRRVTSSRRCRITTERPEMTKIRRQKRRHRRSSWNTSSTSSIFGRGRSKFYLERFLSISRW